MRTDTLHQITQSDTPEAVNVPKDLNGLIEEGKAKAEESSKYERVALALKKQLDSLA